MIKWNTKWIFVSFLVLIISINIVYGLGVSPARSTINFESSLEFDGEFKLLNEEGSNLDVAIYIEDLIEGSTLNLEESDISFLSGQKEASIKYHLLLPSFIESPGEQDIKIIAREISKSSNMGGTFIGASTAVVHQLRVVVPYPGNYAKSELLITETGRMDQVDFIVALNNLGKNAIKDAKPIIEVYNSINDKKVANIEGTSFSVKSGERKEILIVWNEGVEIGKYYAKLKVIYEGGVSEALREFMVGKSLVDVISIYVKDFSLGEIAKFNILVENQWPDTIHDVYTNFVFSQMGEEVDSFKSATDDVLGGSKKELTAYWDTENVKEGEYDTQITLYYDDQKVEKNLKTKVSINSIIFEGLTGAVTGSPDGLNGNILIATLLVIGLTSGFWIFYFKMKKKKNVQET